MDKVNKRELVDELVKLEWEMFEATQNVGGRASCQDDWMTFQIMRASQHEAWEIDTLLAYKLDLLTADALGDNLVTLKYARMMEVTYPEEFLQIKDRLPQVSLEKQALVDAICAIHNRATKTALLKYPLLVALGRPVDSHGSGRWAAMDNYLRSELLTYSEPTLALVYRDSKAYEDAGENIMLLILKNTARRYGYKSLDELEKELYRGNARD